MSEDDRDGLLRRLARRRTPLVVVPLIVGVALSAILGAQLLWADLPETDAAEAPATCWDGSVVAGGDQCARPTGAHGLRWVFPSFRPGADACRDLGGASSGPGRRTAWACEFEMAGSPVVITYLELGPDGRDALEREYAGAERRSVKDPGGRLLRHEWRRALPRGGFAVAAIYPRHPFAVQVVAEDRASREEALRSTVRFRDPAELTRR